MKKLFHVSPIEQPINTILQPGKFGGIIRSYLVKRSTVDTKTLNTIAWESNLEVARLSQSPTLPSRLNCLFGCPTMEEAAQFQARFRGGASSIFEIHVSNSTPIHLADFESITTTIDGKPFVDTFIETAMKYWRTKPKDTLREVLIGGPAVVIAKVA